MRKVLVVLLLGVVLCCLGQAAWAEQDAELTGLDYLQAAREAEEDHNSLRALFYAGKVAGFSSFVDVADDECPPLLNSSSALYQEALEIIAGNSSLLLWATPVRALQSKSSVAWRVVWSPDGKLMATFVNNFEEHCPCECYPGAVWPSSALSVWNVENGVLLDIIDDDGIHIKEAAWSSDGKYIAVYKYDNGVVVYSIASGEAVMYFDWSSGFDWSPEGSRIALWSSYSVKVYDVESATQVTSLFENDYRNGISEVEFNYNGSTLTVSCGDSCRSGVWFTNSGELFHEINNVDHVFFDHSGSMVITGYDAWTMDPEIRRAQDFTIVHTLPEVESSSFSATWSPDDERIAMVDRSSVGMYDPVQGSLICKFHDHWEPVEAVYFSPSGGYVASVDKSNMLHVWESETCTVAASIEGGYIKPVLPSWHPSEDCFAYWDNENWLGGAVSYLCADEGFMPQVVTDPILTFHEASWSPDMESIISTSSAGLAVIHDAESGVIVNQYASSTSWVRPNLDGTLVASGLPGGDIQLFNIVEQKAVGSFGTFYRSVGCAEWSPDGRLFAVGGSDNNVSIWDSECLERVAFLPGFHDQISSIVWSPDASKIVFLSGRQMSLWDVASERKIAYIDGTESVHFNSEGSLCAAVGRSSRSWEVSIVDVQTGSIIKTISGQQFAWSCISNVYAIASDSGVISICNLDKNADFSSFQGLSRMKGLAWSPNNAYIASFSNSIIEIFDVATGEKVITLESPAWFDNVVWSQDSTRILASGSGIFVWDLTGNARGKFSSDIMRFANFDGLDLTFSQPLGNIGEVLTITRQ